MITKIWGGHQERTMVPEDECIHSTWLTAILINFPVYANNCLHKPACQCRRQRRCQFDPWVRKILWRMKGQPTPVFLPGEAHGQRSLRGYSPWGHKELDMTEWLSKWASVQFSHSVMSDSLQPHESHHARPPCLSPSPGVHTDSHPSSPWCHPAISSSVVPFSSCPQSLPASESFPMSQLFAWGGQNTGVSVSASFPPKKSQGWSP